MKASISTTPRDPAATMIKPILILAAAALLCLPFAGCSSMHDDPSMSRAKSGSPGLKTTPSY